ncbi:MAG: lipase family protein [Bryobacteraceae bacterium]
MPLDPNFVIDTIYPAANSAYLIMTVPDPPLPEGFSLVGAIEAKPQQVQALMAKATPAQHRMVNSMLSDSNIFGLVAWNAEEKTAMAAFRGTIDMTEWIEDFDAVAVPYTAASGIGLVHMGFQLVYQHVRQSLAQLLASGCAGAARILITGHSLGAALAILSGFDIARNDIQSVAPEFYTLAGPRTGAPDFAQKFNAAFPVCYRVVNFMDVVPQVPLPPLYEHVGTEVLIHGGFKPLDVTYAHHLTTYLAGLQKLLPAQASATSV